MAVAVVTPPQPIIDVATARARLSIAAATDDATVTAWVAAATQAIDGPTGWLNRAVGQQTLKLSLPSFPCESWGCNWDQGYLSSGVLPPFSIVLPYPEIIEVDALAYVDQDGASQTLSVGSWMLADRLLMPLNGAVWPTSANRAGAVQITYRAGYETVPETIKQAIILSVSQMRSMQGRDPLLTTDTSYGVGSQSFATSGGAGFDSAVRAMLEPFRVIE